MKTKLNVFMGAMALILAAVAIIACSKEKTAQQETIALQQSDNSHNLTLAEMIEAMSWEEGRAFFENQPIKDYTAVCEMLMSDCDFEEKEAGLPFVISWELRMPNETCNPNYSGACLIIRKKEDASAQTNAMRYYEGGKLVIVPVTEENGFTADGYLAIGSPIEVEGDNVVIQEGIYTAYYDEDVGRYVAVAVDYSIKE
jgi:hypothetical protein